jgi:hypothetical protein
MKCSSLRIKPLMMKRCGRNMSMKKYSKKKKNNFKEVQHAENPDETSVSIFPLEEDEFVHPYFPPACKYEELISLNDADDSVEDFLDTVD